MNGPAVLCSSLSIPQTIEKAGCSCFAAEEEAVVGVNVCIFWSWLTTTCKNKPGVLRLSRVPVSPRSHLCY